MGRLINDKERKYSRVIWFPEAVSHASQFVVYVSSWQDIVMCVCVCWSLGGV